MRAVATATVSYRVQQQQQHTIAVTGEHAARKQARTYLSPPVALSKTVDISLRHRGCQKKQLTVSGGWRARRANSTIDFTHRMIAPCFFGGWYVQLPSGPRWQPP